MKLFGISLCLPLSALSLCSAAALFADASGGLLVNGSFEAGPDGLPAGWKYNVMGHAKASMKVVKGAGVAGSDALLISNASPVAPNVYATLSQSLRLEKGAKYSLSVWCKGSEVRDLIFIQGKTWKNRKHFEDVGPEWRKFSFEVLPEEGEFEADGSYSIRVNTDNVTKEAWLSKMELTPLNVVFGVGRASLQASSVLPVAKTPSPFESLASIPACATVVALPSDPAHFSEGRMPEDGDLKASAAFLYDSKGLIVLADVKDNALFTVPGENLWTGDSIQIMIDQTGALNDSPKPGDLELSVSPGPGASSPECYSHTLNRSLSASELEMRSCKTDGGYFLALRVSWSFLKDFDPAKGVLSANLVVNDNDGQGRKVAFLADGIHNFKSCAQNALLILADGRPKAVVAVKDGVLSELLLARLAVDASFAGPLKLSCSDVAGRKRIFDLRSHESPEAAIFRVAEISVDVSDLKPGPIGIELLSEGSSLASVQSFKKDLFKDFKSELAAFEPSLAAFKAAAKPFLTDDFNSAYLKSSLLYAEREAELLRKDAARSCEDVEGGFYGKRGLQEFQELQALVAKGLAMVEELKKTSRPGRYAFNPVASSGLVLKDGWLMSKPLDNPSQKELDPAIISGYGHFGGAIADIPLFSETGCNAVQTEFGPSKVVMGENPDGSFVIDTSKVEKSVAEILERAAKNNVAVIFLLSPHYFPGWALAKHPEVKSEFGFLKYEFNHPYARSLIGAYLKAVIPVLKKDPNAAFIHSLCLSNEPTYKPSLATEFTRKEFVKFLAAKYGDVQGLDKAWGVSAKSFEEAIGTVNPSLGKACDGFNYDFHIFAQDAFSGWHRWMAEAIRSEWPSIPLHSKIMIEPTIAHQSYSELNVDPEAFSSIMDLNGNDNSFYLKREGEAAWLSSAMGYAVQRSFKKAQIVNSENHIIPDRNLKDQPYDFIYTSIFQQFMYGMGSSTIWVWDDWDYGYMLKKHDFVGDIYRRPMSAYAVSAATMDAARLAPEVKAFFDAESEVAIVHSRTAALLDHSYLSDACKLFARLSATGRKTGFLSEAQLCEGRISRAKILFAPGCEHFDRKALAALAKLSKGPLKVVTVGDAFKKDAYGAALDSSALSSERFDSELNSKESVSALSSLLDAKLQPLPFKLECPSKDGLLGVEWKLVRDASGSFLLNATNYSGVDKELKIVPAKGGSVDAEDMIACSKAPSSFTLKPLQPKLLKISKNGFFGGLMESIF